MEEEIKRLKEEYVMLQNASEEYENKLQSYISDQLIPLIQTQRSHIDTQHKIILQIQKELKLSLECDDEDRLQIINELITFIDKLDIEEKTW